MRSHVLKSLVIVSGVLMSLQLMAGPNTKGDEIVNLVLKPSGNTLYPRSNPLRYNATVDAIMVDSVKSDTHTEIVPQYTAEGLKFTLNYDQVAAENPDLMVKDLAALNLLKMSPYQLFAAYGNLPIVSEFFDGTVNSTALKEIESPHVVAEILTNIQLGSLSAKARWAEIQAEILKTLTLKPEVVEKLGLNHGAIEDHKQKLVSAIPQLIAEAQKRSKIQAKDLIQDRSSSGKLNTYEEMDLKLNDLVLNNDRSGVRKLLEAYLPWPVMEPVETAMWKTWLEAIEFPDLNNTMVAFRGVNYETDKLQRRMTSQGERIGMLSTVLTQNQGNYTRRLRSLTTNRIKIGDFGYINHGSQNLSVKMSDQMSNHSGAAVASNFLSFTLDPYTAKSFAGASKQKENTKGVIETVHTGGLVAVKMDARRLVPNLLSSYSRELELLAPLIVFPDEIVKYHEGSFDIGGTKTLENFIREVSATSGTNFNHIIRGSEPKEQGPDLNKVFKEQGHSFFKKVFDKLDSPANMCGNVFSD